MTTTVDRILLPRRPRSWLGLLPAQLGPVLGLMLVSVLFTLLRPSSFATLDNLRIMLMQTAVVGTCALGMTMVIISGGIDLSVGSNIALTCVATALFLHGGWNAALASFGAILLGGTCGLVIGLLIVGRLAEVGALLAALLVAYYLHAYLEWQWWLAALTAVPLLAIGLLAGRRVLQDIPLAPFIVTLGMWGSLRGLAKWLADEQTVQAPADKAQWLITLMRNPSPQQQWMLVAPGVWLTLALAIVVAAALRYTRFGRHVFAIGSNEQTARLCGIAVGRNKVLIYLIGGLFAGLSGVLQFSYLTVGDPTTANGMELDIIAAVVIGGASLSGGQGSIAASLIGAMIMTVVANGCTKVNLSNSVQEIVTGGIIIFAVAVYRLRRKEEDR